VALCAGSAEIATSSDRPLDNKLHLACTNCIRAVSLVVANALSVGERHVKEIVPVCRSAFGRYWH
jgi:hypothetical protein